MIDEWICVFAIDGELLYFAFLDYSNRIPRAVARYRRRF